MDALAPVRLRKSKQSRWLEELDRIISAVEAAEMELSSHGGEEAFAQRKASGSYYTPVDVADHFWNLFFRHHRIDCLSALLAFIGSVDLVEPSVGSGVFVFTFLKKASSLGATPKHLAALRFHVVDINLAALRFFSERLKELEAAAGVQFQGIGPSQKDFLQWASDNSVSNAVFVGNPPFVTNARGARWRNVYADFLEAMIKYPTVRGISLILPLSISFSRDYSDLRSLVRAAGMGVSVSSYDNMPDCLFKAGKPGSANTNQANSQRCSILNIGGPDNSLREATALLNWTAGGRTKFLSSIPVFHAFDANDTSGQFPRPVSSEVLGYIYSAKGARPLGTFLTKLNGASFAIGSVARNYIGIREASDIGAGSIPVRVSKEEDFLLLLQIFSSRLFFDYWRTYGDGFHVTSDLIERFPVTEALVERLTGSSDFAKSIWKSRSNYAKEKLNSGIVVKSYDFRGAFSA